MIIYKVCGGVLNDTISQYREYSAMSLTWSMSYTDRLQWLRTIQSLAVL